MRNGFADDAGQVNENVAFSNTHNGSTFGAQSASARFTGRGSLLPIRQAAHTDVKNGLKESHLFDDPGKPPRGRLAGLIGLARGRRLHGAATIGMVRGLSGR